MTFALDLLTAKSARCRHAASRTLIYRIIERERREERRAKTMNENELSNIVIGLAIKIHKALGPGLLESAYREPMFYEINKAGLYVEKEKPLPLIYEEVKLDVGYRIDLLVEHKLVLELKSVEALAEIHLAQVLTYLRLSGCKLGLLINFNVTVLKNGIKRVVNNL